MWTLLVGAALAGPSSVLLEDGSVLGTVSVRAPVDVVRSRVSDPAWVSATEGGGTKVTVTGRDGACLLIDAVTPTVVVEAHYATRQCPTADGVLATLRSSNAFTDYTTSWRVMPDGAGSRIEYRLSMKTKLMVPQSFISGTLRSRVQGLMEKVGAALGG
ncbi:MAG: hypothetical protein V4850_16535 [Myxococcota bacterium]